MAMEMYPFTRSHAIAFRVLHALAICFHVADGVLGLLILRGTSTSVTFAHHLPKYTAGDLGDQPGCPAVRGDGTYTITYEGKCAFEWNGLLALVVAEFITAAFHFLYLLEVWWVYNKSIDTRSRKNESFGVGFVLRQWWKDHYHTLRWIEYAVSATLISLSNLGGVGIQSVPAFIVALGALVGVQGCGLVIETATAIGEAYEPESRRIMRIIKATALATGGILQGLVFVAIFTHLANADMSYSAAEGEPKENFDGFSQQSWVYFAHYMTFPVIATLYAYGRSLSKVWDRLGINTFATAEWAYVSAGVCSKVAIFWLIFGTVRDFQENFTKEIPKSGVNWPALRISMMIVPAVALVASILFYYFGFIKKKR